MKRLIMINGAMGVGKSAVSRQVQRLLPACALLDGDWCWNVHPFSVTEESKRRVIDHIVTILHGYLACADVQNVVFCWVMQRREIAESILARLPLGNASVARFTLTASPETVAARLRGDVAAGLRDEDVIARALAYLPFYAQDMGSVKLATDGMSAEETAREIARIVQREENHEA